jgi:hypothetical protein
VIGKLVNIKKMLQPKGRTQTESAVLEVITFGSDVAAAILTLKMEASR